MSNHDPDPNDTPEEGPRRPEWTPGRRLSRKGMSRTRAEDLNAHAQVEARRKAERRERRTPSRDDVARAALHSLLTALAREFNSPAAQLFRELTLNALDHALFDPEEARRVLADMIVRADHDLNEWVYDRVFRAWHDGGCKGPRPERPTKAVRIPRRPNGTMPWTNTEPRPPGPRRPWRRRRVSPDDAA
ncbi:hypothetical protein MBRA_06391 [Methylobacterium brachiatum]|jgi:hypothetical protein|nr:hypothetical protein MBRA_06391 [Methylobacterium brachiatum]